MTKSNSKTSPRGGLMELVAYDETLNETHRKPEADKCIEHLVKYFSKIEHMDIIADKMNKSNDTKASIKYDIPSSECSLKLKYSETLDISERLTKKWNSRGYFSKVSLYTWYYWNHTDAYDPEHKATCTFRK